MKKILKEGSRNDFHVYELGSVELIMLNSAQDYHYTPTYPPPSEEVR